MSQRKFTRRSVLAGATAAGVVGSIGGATVALLNDAESSGGTITSGTLDLEVEWDVEDGGSGVSEGTAAASIRVTNEEPSGVATFSLRLPGGSNTPAYGWLRPTCPDPPTPATHLGVTLSYGEPAEPGGTITGPQSLSSFANEFRNGIPLDAGENPDAAPGQQACLRPGSALDVRLEWVIDDDFDGETATSFAFEFVGQQCRHADGTTNPFPTRDPCESGGQSEEGDST